MFSPARRAQKKSRQNNARQAACAADELISKSRESLVYFDVAEEGHPPLQAQKDTGDVRAVAGNTTHVLLVTGCAPSYFPNLHDKPRPLPQRLFIEPAPPPKRETRCKIVACTATTKGGGGSTADASPPQLPQYHINMVVNPPPLPSRSDRKSDTDSLRNFRSIARQPPAAQVQTGPSSLKQPLGKPTLRGKARRGTDRRAQ